MARRTRRFAVAALTLLALGAVGAGWSQAQESPNYKLKRLTISFMGGRATSASYRHSIGASAIEGSVAMCPGGTASSLGFFSVLGKQDVPIHLFGDRGIGEYVDLEWTGQSGSFDVYRSTSPQDVENPINFLRRVFGCTSTDNTATGSTIFFYSVVPH